MISRADFVDVFPAMAEPEANRERGMPAPCTSRLRPAAWKYDVCIARWEDDGGNGWQPSHRQVRQLPDASRGDRMMSL